MFEDALLIPDLLLFIQAFVTLFAIFDPIGILPISSSIIGRLPQSEWRRIIRISCIISFSILVIFALAGDIFFSLLGITLNDFKIVGGIILLIFSIRYVLGREHNNHFSNSGEDIAIFPLATPLLAGPGSISAVILLMNPPYGPLTTLLVISLNVILAWLLLRVGMKLYRKLGKGSIVISRIMGLIIGAIAVRYIREGIIDLIFLIM
jgi:multiple antibiotic resistance protein